MFQVNDQIMFSYCVRVLMAFVGTFSHVINSWGGRNKSVVVIMLYVLAATNPPVTFFNEC